MGPLDCGVGSVILLRCCVIVKCASVPRPQCGWGSEGKMIGQLVGFIGVWPATKPPSYGCCPR